MTKTEALTPKITQEAQPGTEKVAAQGETKAQAKAAKAERPRHEIIEQYAKSVAKRHSLPGSLVEKLIASKTKGEAKRLVRNHLRAEQPV